MQICSAITGFAVQLNFEDRYLINLKAARVQRLWSYVLVLCKMFSEKKDVTLIGLKILIKETDNSSTIN